MLVQSYLQHTASMKESAAAHEIQHVQKDKNLHLINQEETKLNQLSTKI